MIDISERLVVHCPDHEASHYLGAFVADHEVGDGTVRIALRWPISRLGDRRPLNERPVVAILYRLQSAADPYPTYSVTWLPKGDGPSPEFAGALAVERNACNDRFGLLLSGRYTPFREAGARCDFERDRRIARVPARDVLRAITDYVEYSRAHNEAAVAGHHRHSRPMKHGEIVVDRR